MKPKKYDTRGMEETCLNCAKSSCALAGVGNEARINENNGCWTANKYLELDCKAYLIKKKFLEFIKDTKLYIVEDCYKLMFKQSRWNNNEIADLYFLDDMIKVNTDEFYLTFVTKIFDDFSKVTKTKVKISLSGGDSHYY